MKSILFAFLPMIMLFSCKQKTREFSSVNPVNWKKRSIHLHNPESMYRGSTYLSVYSDIYSMTEKITHALTVTVSMRNISSTDSVFVLKADYYDSEGDLIRTYFKHPIYIKPMETVEIVIDQNDTHGGTGANFIFEWASQKENLEPLFEAVMITMSGQQGISFSTQGVKR